MATEKPERLLGRDFVLLWQGQLVSQLGNQAFLVATISWTLDATGSPGLMGLLLMTSTVPAVVFGPFAGAIADRHSRRGLIVAADFLRGLGHLAVAGVMLVSPESTQFIVGVLLVQGVLSGSLGALLTPALAAAIPDVVPPGRLAAANSLHHLSLQATALSGQAAGGIVYSWIGAPALVLFDGLTFLASAGCARLARLPHVPPAAIDGARLAVRAYARDVLDGTAWLWRHPFLRSVTLTFTGVNLLFAPVLVLLPIYVRERLGEGPEWYGFLLAAAGAGAMAGAALVPIVLEGPRALMSALLGIGFCTTALGAGRSALLALTLLFAIGLFSGILNVRVMTVLQASTPPELRGRTLAVTIALAGVAVPAGLGLGGWIGGLASTSLGWVVCGCGIGILAIAALAPSPEHSYGASDSAPRDGELNRE